MTVSTQQEYVYKYERKGFEFTIYKNRIDIVDGIWKTLAKKTTILLKNVASVEIKGLTRKLYIKTNDNKTFEYIVGLEGQTIVDTLNSLL